MVKILKLLTKEYTLGHWLNSGDKYMIAPSMESLHEGLPVGVYTIEESMAGPYFARTSGLASVERVYGNHNRWADRIITSYGDRAGNTGVLLSGVKGSGKSLLGRLLVERGAALGMPCILVNAHREADLITKLITNLSQPSVILLDEFDKNFSKKEEQNGLLSLMDGTANTNHLFIVTVNRKDLLSDYLVNRPGRLYYSIDFTGLDEDFIREYAVENLKNQSELEGLTRIARIIGDLSFDGLKAIVEEMNRFNESAKDAVELLNIAPSNQNKSYLMEAWKGTQKLFISNDTSFYGDPFRPSSAYAYVYASEAAHDADEDTLICYEFNLADFKKFDTTSGVITYESGEYEIRLIENRTPAFQWRAL